MIDDPPPVVALRGKLKVLKQPLIAIVGSRNASAAGVNLPNASHVISAKRDLSPCQDWPAGSTPRPTAPVFQQGPLPCSPAVTSRHPAEHIELLDKILANGAAISEMPFTREPRAHDFPRRNRLISGLSLGVVVVEAARRSGSLITARFPANKAVKFSRCPVRHSIASEEAILN